MRHTNPSGEFIQCTVLLDADSTLRLAKHDVCNVRLTQPCYSALLDILYLLLYYRPIDLVMFISQLRTTNTRKLT